VNVFVAGFIGFPQMNFWNAKLTEFEGSIILNWNNHKFKLPYFNENQRGYIGKDIIATIRAENIYTDKANISKYKDSVIDTEVKTVEFYGLTTYIHIGDDELTASIPDECNVKMGDRIRASFNPDKIYLFDKDTENVIDYKL